MTRYLTLFLCAALAGCAPSDESADAWGNFEATEIMVSAEAGGRLVSFSAREGAVLASGSRVGLVDTLQLALRRDQVLASQGAVRSRLIGIRAQVQVLTEQRRVAVREFDRVAGLLEDGAATQKQVDDAEGALAVLERQIAAAESQAAPVRAEVAVLETQLAQIDDSIRRSTVLNPVRGTVLATYAEASEMTAPGRPLYKIAPLDTLELRAYVSGAMLPDVRLGDTVTVLVDRDAETNREVNGRVSWIASEAEFTPKLIQTKEARVDLMYAFKVRVPNPDGILKIGMPGAVRLSD